MESKCIYDCVHPWWGGGGSCTVSDAGDPVCVCDAGYASRDASGDPSCVPRRVLVAAYLFLAALSVLAAVLIVWKLNGYRHLPVRIQTERKTLIRMRALVSSSLYVMGFGSLGYALAARAGETTYTDLGLQQVIYIILLPLMVFAIAMIAQYWVECLPSQVLSPGSFAGKLRNASETTSAFVMFGLACSSPISVLGVLTLFFQGWPRRVADMVVGALTVGTVGVIVFVAVQITGVINRALVKGSKSSKAFYFKARRNLWRQAATLCGVACVMIVVTLIKQLTTIGQGTPSIISTLQILCAHAAAAVFASATRFEAPPSMARDGSFDDRSIASRPHVGRPRGSSASASNTLWLTQSGGFRTATEGPGEKAEPASSGSGVQDNGTNKEIDAFPIKVVLKLCESSRRHEANRHPRDADAARVVPVNEDRVSSFSPDRSSTCCLPKKEWTFGSMDSV